MLQKNAKNKNFTVLFPDKTPLKLKKYPQNQTVSIPCNAASTAGPCPTITVLQQCADGMATE